MDSSQKGSFKSLTTTLTTVGDRWALWRCWNAVSSALRLSGCTLQKCEWSGGFANGSLTLTVAGYESQLKLVKAVLLGWHETGSNTYSELVEAEVDPVAPAATIEYEGSHKAWGGNFALNRCWTCLARMLVHSGCTLKLCNYGGWDVDGHVEYTIVGTEAQISTAKAVFEGWRTA